MALAGIVKVNIFMIKKKHSCDFAELQKDWKRSHEDFKKHYEENYSPLLYPPAWMIFETTTFGVISKFFSNIDSAVPEKTKIAEYFGFTKSSVRILVSWIHHLYTVRNICAHHSRLYSRVIIIKPVFPKKIKGNWVSAWPKDDRIYASICIIKKLLDVCVSEFDFIGRLKQIIEMAREDQLPSMGFPENWKEEDLFK